ncbi:MAG: hypothetical protein ABN482_14550 [Corticimicrobacter sp.]|uniref:membrane protein YczE n=1 Tax=Corticimicrobacter sp. TaxID=2678536 RepID=UPI0032DA0F6B
MQPVAHTLRRAFSLLLGLFLFGIGISLMVKAALGIPPWEVLAQGIALRTGIPFGLANNILGLAVLLLWIPLRQKPGIGTIANALLVGPSAQLGLFLLPVPGTLPVQILVFAAGMIILAIGTALYIGAQYGPGPRDGLMTGLHARTSRPIWQVRGSIELVVMGFGWGLGGDVGWGTLLFAAGIGPLCGVTLPLLAPHMYRKKS